MSKVKIKFSSLRPILGDLILVCPRVCLYCVHPLTFTQVGWLAVCGVLQLGGSSHDRTQQLFVVATWCPVVWKLSYFN